MNDLYLSYDDNDACHKESLNSNKFLELQKVIYEDIRKIWILVSDYYNDSKEREHLLCLLKGVMEDIVRSKFIIPYDALNIRVYQNYLVFSYYKLDEHCSMYLESPSIVIITRDMKNLYFIDEEYSVFYDEEEDDELNRGHDEICYFKLDKGVVKEYKCSLEEYTADLFQNSFWDASYMIMKLENKGKEI